MGIALFTTARLLAPLQPLVAAAMRGFRRHAAASWRATQPSVAAHACVLPKPSFAQGVARATGPRPLRVVRVLEGVHGKHSAGRMVISGRMADVCAELDRLAAVEALGS